MGLFGFCITLSHPQLKLHCLPRHLRVLRVHRHPGLQIRPFQCIGIGEISKVLNNVGNLFHFKLNCEIFRSDGQFCVEASSSTTRNLTLKSKLNWAGPYQTLPDLTRPYQISPDFTRSPLLKMLEIDNIRPEILSQDSNRCRAFIAIPMNAVDCIVGL